MLVSAWGRRSSLGAPERAPAWAAVRRGGRIPPGRPAGRCAWPPTLFVDLFIQVLHVDRLIGRDVRHGGSCGLGTLLSRTTMPVAARPRGSGGGGELAGSSAIWATHPSAVIKHALYLHECACQPALRSLQPAWCTQGLWARGASCAAALSAEAGGCSTTPVTLEHCTRAAWLLVISWQREGQREGQREARLGYNAAGKQTHGVLAAAERHLAACTRTHTHAHPSLTRSAAPSPAPGQHSGRAEAPGAPPPRPPPPRSCCLDARQCSPGGLDGGVNVGLCVLQAGEARLKLAGRQVDSLGGGGRRGGGG